jgi:hemoglobin/transferrin/lactoferrin receptor protein
VRHDRCRAAAFLERVSGPSRGERGACSRVGRWPAPSGALPGWASLAWILAVATVATAGASPPAVGSPVGAAPSEASTPDRPAAPPTLWDTVTVVASKVPERVGDVAGTVTVLERADLDRQLVQDLADVVRHEPGVVATGQPGRFGLSGLRIRGMEGNRVAVEVDGVPLREGFVVGSFANAGRAGVEPELLAGVEILRGPASVLYGSDALGGVVALRTLGPQDLLTGLPDHAWSLRLAGDGRDRGRRASALGAVAGGRWQGLALVSARRADEVANGGSIAPDPARREERSGLLRVVRLFDRGWLDLGVDHQQSTAATDVQHLLGGPGQFATTTALGADDRDRRTRVVLRQSVGPAGRWLEQADWRLAWSETATRQDSDQFRAAEPRTPYATRRERRFVLEEAWWGGEWTARTELDLLGLAHRLVWGVELERSTVEELRDGRETNLATGVSTPVILGERMPVRDFPRSTVTTVAVYLGDDLALGSGRWRLQPGLRWERTVTRAAPDALYREDFPNTPVVDIDATAWTPKLGLTRELGAGHSAYVQVAEGFRAPPFHDVNVGLRIATFGYEAIPNPELEAERSRGVELGWRYAGRALAVQLAAFENRYHDLIESRVNLGRDPQTGITTFQSRNRDRATIHGVEGRWRWDLGATLPAVRGITVDGSFAWAEGKDTRLHQPLPSVDPARGTLGVGYRAPSGAWSLGAVGTFVAAARATRDGRGAELFAAPGYELLDLHCDWQLYPSWSLRLALWNALDRQSWSSGKLRGVLASDPQRDFYSEPGRAVVLGIGWRR